MSAGVWIFLGLVVVAIAILKGKSGGSKAPEERSVEDRFKEKDALAPELVKECVAAAKALPIVDEKSSWLFHEPVYDARTDFFDPPCKENDFPHSFGKCWMAPDTLPKVFEVYADQEAGFRLNLSRPRSSCVIAAADHIDVILCDHSVNEPGVNVLRVSRVAEDRWHVYAFRCGMAPGGLGLAAGNVKVLVMSEDDGLDPPLLAVDVARDPMLWVQREEKLRKTWKRSGTWREAARLCTHQPQA